MKLMFQKLSLVIMATRGDIILLRKLMFKVLDPLTLAVCNVSTHTHTQIQDLKTIAFNIKKKKRFAFYFGFIREE